MRISETGSLWEHTAGTVATRSALSETRQTDVVIVGGGLTGLSAALHVVRHGREAIVLEGNQVGWGASGRAGGVVSPKFRVALPTLADRFGLDVARQVHRVGCDAVDLVESLVEEIGISHANFMRSGHITAAHSAKAEQYLQHQCKWLEDALKDSGCVFLSKGQVDEEIGSSSFRGAMLNKRAGTIHPLNFSRGIAAYIEGQGVRIYENSPAIEIRERGDGVSVVTPSGEVRARQAILGTNAYSNQSPAANRLFRRIIPFRSAIIATERLPESMTRGLLVNRRAYGDTRRLLRWFRIFDGRMVFGGRGAFGRKDSKSAYNGLRRHLVKTFPNLSEVRIDFGWSGLVAMTMDYLPHIGKLSPNIFFALGYNGTGIAMSTLMGKVLDETSRGEKTTLPLMASSEFRPIPLHRFRAPAVRLAAGWQQGLDWLGR